MRVTATAEDFDPVHTVAEVSFFADVFPVTRRPKAWPASARVEFRLGAEELSATAYAVIYPLLVTVPVLAGKRSLAALLSRYPELFGSEQLLPLIFLLDDFFFHALLAIVPEETLTAYRG